MSRILHQLVGYGAGAVGFLVLGLNADKKAETLPFVTQIHAIPVLEKTYVFDQRSEGGERFEPRGRCETRARVLVRSDQPLKTLQRHYAKHRIDALEGNHKVRGTVKPASEVADLTADWLKYRTDPTVYVAEFVSPGTPGSEPFCGR